MRIIVLRDETEAAEQATVVARLLAERLGDAVQLLGEVKRTSLQHAAASTGAGHVSDGAESTRDEGDWAGASNAPALARVLEACERDDPAAEPVRCVVVPGAGESTWREEGEPLAGEVALHAPVPTLVVRDVSPLSAWTQGRRTLRVLLAHDLTRIADDALGLLKQLTTVNACEIVVVHVHRPLEAGVRLPGGGGAACDCEAEVQRILRTNLVERVQRALGEVAADVRVCPTPLRHDLAVVELARNEGFDLIMAGTHQRHGLERLGHAGSLSRALLRLGGANVLLVPQARRRLPGAPGRVTRVLVATDLTPAGNEAVPHAFGLLPQGGTVRLVHVVHPRALPDGEFDQGLVRGRELVRHREVLHESRARLRALTPVDASGVETEVDVLEHAEPAEAIAEAAERFGADVVCLSAREPDSLIDRLFRTQLQRLMEKTNRTLLLVRPRCG